MGEWITVILQIELIAIIVDNSVLSNTIIRIAIIEMYATFHMPTNRISRELLRATDRTLILY